MKGHFKIIGLGLGNWLKIWMSNVWGPASPGDTNHQPRVCRVCIEIGDQAPAKVPGGW